MCHLKRFCEDPIRAGQNEVTEVLARVQKHVDKFHFRESIEQKGFILYDRASISMSKGLTDVTLASKDDEAHMLGLARTTL